MVTRDESVQAKTASTGRARGQGGDKKSLPTRKKTPPGFVSPTPARLECHNLRLRASVGAYRRLVNRNVEDLQLEFTELPWKLGVLQVLDSFLTPALRRQSTGFRMISTVNDITRHQSTRYPPGHAERLFHAEIQPHRQGVTSPPKTRCESMNRQGAQAHEARGKAESATSRHHRHQYHHNNT